MSYHAACKDVSIDDPKSIELTADLFSEYFFKIIGGVARAHVSKTAPDIEPSKRLGLQGLLLLLILLLLLVRVGLGLGRRTRTIEIIGQTHG